MKNQGKKPRAFCQHLASQVGIYGHKASKLKLEDPNSEEQALPLRLTTTTLPGLPESGPGFLGRGELRDWGKFSHLLLPAARAQQIIRDRNKVSLRSVALERVICLFAFTVRRRLPHQYTPRQAMSS